MILLNELQCLHGCHSPGVFLGTMCNGDTHGLEDGQPDAKFKHLLKFLSNFELVSSQAAQASMHRTLSSDDAGARCHSSQGEGSWMGVIVQESWPEARCRSYMKMEVTSK